jgi:DNA-directed RNA polymerase subunit N (RpoN/RPB10)
MDKYAKIGLPCLNCGEHTEQSVPWLEMHDRLFCFACGSAINLTTPEFREYIKELSRLGAALHVLGVHHNERGRLRSVEAVAKAARLPVGFTGKRAAQVSLETSPGRSSTTG